MALSTLKAPVDYSAQQSMRPRQTTMIMRLMIALAAFEDFLSNYKSTQTDLEIAATDAFQNLDIDEDGTSDEYDMMDDVTGGKETRQKNADFKEAKRKYMDMLQRVADREISEITIELDDLDNVCCLGVHLTHSC